MAKMKSGRQVRYLLSMGSPLTEAEKKTLIGELRSGAVKVKGGRKMIGRQKRKHVRVRPRRR